VKTVDESKDFLLGWLGGRLSLQDRFSIERREKLIELLREISFDEARLVAAWITQLWASDPRTYGDAERVLLGLSCFFPGSLTGLRDGRDDLRADVKPRVAGDNHPVISPERILW